MPLDPIVAELFSRMVAAGRPALSAGTPEDARRLTRDGRKALGPGPAMREVRALQIPTRAGTIAARLYLPEGDIDGLIAYFHGGGWVVGELDDYDSMARTLAARSRCALLMPAYRLAPEHPFPAGVDDAVDTLEWVAGHIESLTNHRVPLLVAGDSAGGNLTAVAVAESAGRFPIAGQALIYPVTDVDTDSASYRTHSAGMQLTREDMRWFLHHYAPAAQHASPRIAPLRAKTVAPYPPTVVVTAECDVLRDEGEAFAARLTAAGIPVVARRIDGMPHGFLRMHNLVPRADAALTTLATDLTALCLNEAALPGHMKGIAQ